jgi:DNA polymerase-3 subunit beta
MLAATFFEGACMKVQLAKKPLAEALSHVERIVPNRSGNPGLNLVRLTVTAGELMLRGTNMDVDIEASVAVDVTNEGDVALPAQVLGQVIRALPGETVDMHLEDQELVVASDHFDTRLQTVDPENAPTVGFPTEFPTRLDAEALAGALSNVRYAAATAEYQAVFRGVKLEVSSQGQGARAVATDGFRLAYHDLQDAGGLPGDVIVPAKGVDEILKVLSGAEVHMAVGDAQVSVKSGGIKLNVKLMDGTFPDYRRVIPTTFPVTVSVNASDLKEAVSRVSVLADRTANNRVDLFVKEGQLRISAEGSFGRGQEILEVGQTGTDAEMALAFNAKYLLDALASFSDEVDVRFSGVTSPTVLGQPNQEHHLAMVVPLRTN